MVGIGIPIVAPAGKNGVDFYFRLGDTRATKAVVRGSRWSGGYYGPEDFSGASNTGFHALD